jgi:hypothetical protein
LAFTLQTYDTWENWYDPTIVDIQISKFHTWIENSEDGSPIYQLEEIKLKPVFCTEENFKDSRV